MAIARSTESGTWLLMKKIIVTQFFIQPFAILKKKNTLKLIMIITMIVMTIKNDNHHLRSLIIFSLAKPWASDSRSFLMVELISWILWWLRSWLAKVFMIKIIVIMMIVILKRVNVREDINWKKTFSFGHCPNDGGGSTHARIFWPFYKKCIFGQ